jgi:ATP-binding cassette subfamily F protein 3
LLRVLAGELASPTGTIKPHPHLAVGYYAQPHAARLDSGRTVLEEIMSADPDGAPQRARSICGALLFGKDLALKPVSVLSGGEKSRVLLGKILMRPSQLLLLDEPTNHLDMESTQALCRALSEFPGSVVMVTHDEMTLERVAERLLVFDGDGAQYFEGGYREFLDNVGWQDEQEMPDASLGPRAVQPAAGDRQLRKRQAAQLRQERSRVLGPLEEEIRRRETRISELEEELGRVNRELIAASQRADGAAIAEYGRHAKKLPVQIEQEYGVLESLLRKQESLAAEFALRLTEITREPEEHGRAN